MATPNPLLHLLALPRELRDRIYGFLTHDLILKDAGLIFMRTVEEMFKGCPQEPGTASYMDIIVADLVHTTISVENAPYMGVMLASSQIHQEYREFCIAKLSASIRCDRMIEIIGRTTNNFPPPNANTSAALALIKCMTLWLHGDMHRYLRKKDTKPFLDALAVKMAFLQTLRLIIFDDGEADDGEDDDGEDEDSPPHNMSLSNLLPFLPDSFPLMTRKQNVFGQKVWSDALMADFRALVYSSRQRSSELWTPESVMSYWSPEEEACARRLSLPLSVLGQAESMHGLKIWIDKWIDEGCSD